jgi:hypothetical protein
VRDLALARFNQCHADFNLFKGYTVTAVGEDNILTLAFQYAGSDGSAFSVILFKPFNNTGYLDVFCGFFCRRRSFIRAAVINNNDLTVKIFRYQKTVRGNNILLDLVLLIKGRDYD